MNEVDQLFFGGPLDGKVERVPELQTNPPKTLLRKYNCYVLRENSQSFPNVRIYAISHLDNLSVRIMVNDLYKVFYVGGELDGKSSYKLGSQLTSTIICAKSRHAYTLCGYILDKSIKYKTRIYVDERINFDALCLRISELKKKEMDIIYP